MIRVDLQERWEEMFLVLLATADPLASEARQAVVIAALALDWSGNWPARALPCLTVDASHGAFNALLRETYAALTEAGFPEAVALMPQPIVKKQKPHLEAVTTFDGEKTA